MTPPCLAARSRVTRDANGADRRPPSARTYPDLEAKNSAQADQGPSSRHRRSARSGPSGQWRTALRTRPRHGLALLRGPEPALRQPPGALDRRRQRRGAQAVRRGRARRRHRRQRRHQDGRLAAAAGGGFELVSPDGRRATYDAGNTAGARHAHDRRRRPMEPHDSRTSQEPRPATRASTPTTTRTWSTTSTARPSAATASTTTACRSSRPCTSPTGTATRSGTAIQMTYGDGDGQDLPAAVRRPRRGRARADPRRHRVHLEPDLRERVGRAQRGLQRHDGQHHRVLRRRAAAAIRRPCPTGSSARTSSLSPDVFLGLPQHGGPGRGRRSRTTTRCGSSAPPTTAACTATRASPTTPTTWRVAGGQNAGCIAQNGHPATHTADCDVTVPASAWTGPRRSSTTASPACRSTRTSATPATRTVAVGRRRPGRHQRRVGGRRRPRRLHAGRRRRRRRA